MPARPQLSPELAALVAAYKAAREARRVAPEAERARAIRDEQHAAVCVASVLAEDVQ